MQKLIHVDRTAGWMMVHAGLAPKWTTQMAEKLAQEVEQQLHSAEYHKLLHSMYGDKPDWSPALSGYNRSRAIINVLTRMRYCTPRGRISTEDKGTPGTQTQGMYPWFEVPGRVERDLKIVCGHWSTLGLTITQGIHAIDTGAVWGGKLTALQIDTDELRLVQVHGLSVEHPPPTPRRRAKSAPSAPKSNHRTSLISTSAFKASITLTQVDLVLGQSQTDLIKTCCQSVIVHEVDQPNLTISLGTMNSRRVLRTKRLPGLISKYHIHLSKDAVHVLAGVRNIFF